MRFSDPISMDEITKYPTTTFEFFSTFSRFEFALKEWGYIIHSHDERLSSDWKAFSKSLPSDFVAQVIRDNLAPTLIARPPKTQIKIVVGSSGYDGVSAGWGPQPEALDLSENSWQLFQAIKTVRNNLFHGGKSFSSESSTLERERALVNESLACLQEALRWNDDIRLSFEGAY